MWVRQGSLLLELKIKHWLVLWVSFRQRMVLIQIQIERLNLLVHRHGRVVDRWTHLVRLRLKHHFWLDKGWLGNLKVRLSWLTEFSLPPLFFLMEKGAHWASLANLLLSFYLLNGIMGWWTYITRVSFVFERVVESLIGGMSIIAFKS